MKIDFFQSTIKVQKLFRTSIDTLCGTHRDRLTSAEAGLTIKDLQKQI